MNAKPGQYSIFIALRTTVSSLVLLLLLVTAVWSAQSAKAPTAEPSATQKKLIEIYKDPRYPQLRNEYEEALRKKFGQLAPDAFRERQRDPSDFIRFFNENKDKIQEPKLKPPEPESKGSLSAIRAMFERSKPVSARALLSQGMTELFAKSFFDYYSDAGEALSSALIVDLTQDDKIYINVHHRDSQEGKAYVYKTATEMLSSFPKAVKELLAESKSNATCVVSTGDSPSEHTHKEIFKALGLPGIRRISTAPDKISEIGQRREAFLKRFSQMTGENTVVLNGLPADEQGLRNIGKKVERLEQWKDADASLRELLRQEKSEVLEVKANTFKDVLLQSDDKVVITVIANAWGEGFMFPDGSAVTAEDIYRWEQRSADPVKLPAVVFLVCNTANIAPGEPGQVIQALLDKGYILGAKSTKGFISPLRVKDVIRTLLHHEDSAEDKLRELEDCIVHRTFLKHYVFVSGETIEFNFRR